MSSNYFDRGRAALVRFTEAITARTAAESAVESAYQAAVDKAEREAARARKQNAAAREKDLGDIDAAHDAAAKEIDGRCDAEQFTAHRTRDEKLGTTRER